MLDENIVKELKFKAIRSSGSGGQHVNKVSSKVELQFDVMASSSLTENEKLILQEKLKNRLTKENILILHCDESRSQHKNKALVIDRFFGVISDALKIEIERKPTKIPKQVKIKRLKKKRQHSEKKENRKPPEIL